MSGQPSLRSTANASASRGSFGALTPLLAPRSVAVVGASDREGNLGGAAVRFLKKFGYAGPIWPVNRGRPEVAGLPCYPSLRDLPGVPDLAILALPGGIHRRPGERLRRGGHSGRGGVGGRIRRNG